MSTPISRIEINVSDHKWKTVSRVISKSADNRCLVANCIVDKVVPNDPSSGLFSIFDGHGGRQVSDYCAERFPLEIRKELMKNPADLC